MFDSDQPRLCLDSLRHTPVLTPTRHTNFAMNQQPQCRERRSWTAKEDQLLRDAVAKEDPNNSNPSKWHAIAKHVPNRTNKDCRKRWFAKMASDVVKGGWSPEEDERLVKGIERYGTRWSLVASVVQTRNSDQCAKRWTDTLNPAIDRTTWTPEADDMLLRAVEEHGKVWTKIVKTYFPGRTGLSAKNRYNSITRFNPESRNARARRRSVESGYFASRKAESVSSSSSSASPATPNVTLPSLSSPSTQLMLSPGGHSPYELGWQSPLNEELTSLPGYDGPMHSFSPSSCSSSESSYHSVDINMSSTLSTLTDMGNNILYTEQSSQESHYFKSSPTGHGHSFSSSHSEGLAPSYSHYTNSFGAANHSEVTNQFTSLEHLPWEGNTLPPVDSKHGNFKSQLQGPGYPVCSFLRPLITKAVLTTRYANFVELPLLKACMPLTCPAPTVEYRISAGSAAIYRTLSTTQHLATIGKGTESVYVSWSELRLYLYRNELVHVSSFSLHARHPRTLYFILSPPLA
ncbi:hypothetical protein NMY22_g14854 [Coprinellus aureogranulatus]|nr:hypothetical protein NMY22_g14854 [Coprinellus aureogranulatus]